MSPKKKSSSRTRNKKATASTLHVAPSTTDEEFTEWTNSAGISTATIVKLRQAGFTTLRAVKLLREQDIIMLQLDTLAENRLLEQAVDDLKSPPCIQTQRPTPSADADISPPIASLADLLSGCSPESAPTSATAASLDQDPRLLLQPESTGEGLRIVNFIPKPFEDNTAEEEEFAQTADGTTMFVRKAGKRILAHEVSPAQWIVANARIQHALMTAGQLSPQAVPDYLGYTAKIGHYATLYTWQSVMAFDHAYRQSQAALNFRWGTEAQHLVNVHLKRRQVAPSTSGGGVKTTPMTRRQRPNGMSVPPKAQGPFTKDGQEICRLFNDGMCKWGTRCQRAHVCRMPTCEQSHPVFMHTSGTKNAQPQ